MKERTKQILRYVACGLGGLALGIGLLGGLSMCATSTKTTSESVNTILATERVRHNEKTTTASGGYDKYTFSASVGFARSTLWVSYYDFNYTTATLTRTSFEEVPFTSVGWIPVRSYINDAYTNLSVPTDSIKFITIGGNTPLYGSNSFRTWIYYSFKQGTVSTAGYNMSYRSYIKLSPTFPIGIPLEVEEGNGNEDPLWTYTGGTKPATEILTYSKNTVIQFTGGDSTDWVSLSFQDTQSYYLEQGYSAGHTDGYNEGYDDAYAEKDSGIAFTSCGVYPNAQVTLATDETIGNFKYMYLCHYITKPGYDEHTIYILWTTHATTGQYLGQVIDRNDSNSYSPAVTLGSFSEEPTSSVTITATQDMEFGLWVGYITTFHNRGELTNSILWFGGGTSESDLQIYQNGYDEGYQNGNQAGQETGYEQGYERGQEVGDAEGYSRGYTEGFNQTNTKNVFSLFTSAFDSVASFFDLKIFGFLPLYWFFLAPLFIALISLLMRMVKH